MIEEIIEGIVAALTSHFGKTIPICFEPIGDDISGPAFSVICTTTSQKPLLGSRSLCRHVFGVYYRPSDSGGRRELNAVQDKLPLCLEYITSGGDLLRGTDMEAKAEGSMLTFTVHYDFHVYKSSTPDDAMQEYSIEEAVL